MRLPGPLVRIAPAVGVYIGLHVAGLVVLALVQDKGPTDLLSVLGHRYDSLWYERIANDGYGPTAPKSYAMFPLFPAMIAVLAPVTPGPTWTAGLVISWIAGIVAAGGLFQLGKHLRDARTGLLLVALWAVVPHAVIEVTGYTESLFTAFAAWALYALLSQRWVTAGVLTLLAGLTRPSASALVVAVGLAAGVAVLRRWDGWRPWACGVIAPVGFVGYIAWVGLRTGRPDGYFWVQRHRWGAKFDGGVYTAQAVWGYLSRKSDLAFYACAFVLLVALVLMVVQLAERWPWPLVVYSAVLLVTVIGTAGYFHSKGRLLLPAFTLLLPVAAGLAKVRNRNVFLIVGALACSSAWYGSYLMLMWRYSP
ncbi:hypothetical protein [Phytohabitans houttuyneae]|uniref:Membrane protein n=1 Tax=Phytohabitans houttuyneae TaxID=1076126 RepID=A0A6V8KZB8_9ACTN|nr:hypothetical protein [Phytohabitans houttuyneae]GFJ85865.1 membrane protein [Phytohabitans houttuyneae]